MELDIESFFKLSNEQQEAIFLYAAEKGQNWKDQLSKDWVRSEYNWKHPDKSPLLQQVRNQFGPEWLTDVAVPDVIKYEIYLPERFQGFQLYKLLEFYEVWESGHKVITFDGPAESLNYESAIAWMEQEIDKPDSQIDKPDSQIEYYDSYSYSRHIEGN